MKKSELFALIREYFDVEIKQQVKKALDEELRSRSASKGSKKITENGLSLSNILGDIETENDSIFKKVQKKPKAETQMFKSKNMLSDILNETVADIREANQVEQEEEDDDAPMFDRRLLLSKSQIEKEKNISRTPDSELTEAEIQQKKLFREQYMNSINSESQRGPSSVATTVKAAEMIPEDRKGVPLPQELEAALTKDYSQLVKHFSKKKK